MKSSQLTYPSRQMFIFIYDEGIWNLLFIIL
jgi:hypothetical protein